MRKRFLAIVMCLSMILGYTPVMAQENANGEETTYNIEVTKDAKGTDLLASMEKQSKTKPSGYDDDTATPYGTGSDEKFMIKENAEVFSFMSHDISYDNATIKATSSEGAKNKNVLSDTDSNNEYSKIISKSDVMSFMQGASFDPTNSGKRNYIGVIGYQNDDQSVKLLILNMETKKVVDRWTIASGNASKWIGDTHLDNANARNYFRVTAGDYDGDGYDSLIVYNSSMTGSTGGLKEFRYSNGKFVKYDLNTSNLLNKEYFDNKLYNSNSLGDRLAVALASGDVNKDGIDDLAVISVAGKVSNNKYAYACKPRLVVAYGKKGTTSVNNLSKSSVTVSQKIDGNERTMMVPGIAIGDIDLDGYNEIVAAGYMNYWSANKPINWQDEKECFAYYRDKDSSLSKGTDLQELTGDKVSGFSTGASIRIGQPSWHQMAVECVQFDGLNTREQIVLGGVVLELNEANQLDMKYNDYFKERYKSVAGDDVNENFIFSTAIGNFFNRDNGAEGIVMSVGYRQSGNGLWYNYRRISLVKDASGNYVLSGNDTDRSDAFYFNDKGDEMQNKLNCFVVAMDNDNDSVIGKYNTRAFAYSDPNVVAFLQAAPYFEELEANNSSTSYGYTESYATETATGTDISYSVGTTAGATVGPVTTSLEAGYTGGFSTEYTESRTSEYATTFEANGKNQIIVRRTLIYYYYYDIMKSDGTFEDKGMVVAVPQYPVMSTLTMDEYNKFATAFNDKYGSKKDSTKLDIITDANKKKYFLNNEGNPYNYANDSNSYTNGTDLSQKGWTELSHAGGTAGKEYASSVEESKTTTRSDGFYTGMSLELTAGTNIFGFEVSVSAGFSTNLDWSKSTAKTTSKMVATSTGGSVQNLDPGYEDYKFNWKLISWKTEGDLFKDVLFVGYAVARSSIESKPNPVTDLDASYERTDNTDKVKLTWTSPEVTYNRKKIKSFDVYRIDGEQKKLQSVNNSGAGQQQSCDLEITDGSANATFMVRAIATDGKVSIDSNEAYCLFALSGKDVQELVDNTRKDLQSKIDALNDLINSKDFSQSTDVNKMINEVISEYKKADEVLKKAITEDTDAKLDDLRNTIEDGDSSLVEAVNLVQQNLDDKADELKAAIDKKADAEKLNSTISDLNTLTATVNDLKDSKIPDVEKRIESLKEQFTETNKTLTEAITTINEELAETVKDLAALNTQVTENSSKITDMTSTVNTLSSNYHTSKALLDLEIKNLQGSNQSLKEALESLQSSTTEANEALSTAIELVQSNLDEQVKRLEAKIDKKADAEDLAKAVTKLDQTYALANTLKETDIPALKKDIKALSDTMTEAKDSLNTMISDLETKLNDAVKDLNKKISDGSDKSDAIEKSLTEFTNTYNQAKALSDSEISGLKSSVEELKKADSELGKSIDAVTELLNQQVKELNTAISKKADQSDLDDAVAKLNNVYELANTLNDSDLPGVKDELKTLKSTLSSTEESLKKTISDVEKDLKNEIKVLNTKLNDESSKSDDINKSLANLINDYHASSALVNTDITDLKDEIKSLKSEMKDADDKLSDAIKNVSDDLAAQVKKLNESIDAKASEADLTAAVEKLNETAELVRTLKDSDIPAIKDDVKKLNEDLNGISSSLKLLINDVEAKLDAQLKKLNEKIDSKAYQSDLDDAVAKLNNVYELANTLNNSDLPGIKDELKTLKSTLSSTEESLKKTISDVEKDLKNEIKDLNTKLNDESSKSDDINKSLANLINDYHASSALVNTDITDLKDEIKSLKSEMKDADDKLSDAIKNVSDDLAAQVKKLNESIDAKASEADLTAAVAKLNNVYELANTLNDSDLPGVKDELKTLNTALNNAKTDLNTTISNLEKKLNTEVADLNTKVNDVSAKSDTINTALTTLTETYNQAKPLLDLDIKGVKDNVSSLKTSMNDSNTKLNAAIEALAKRVDTKDAELESRIAKLEAAMTSAAEENTKKTAELEQKINATDQKVEAAAQATVVPELKVGDDKMWYISYDNGKTWTSTGKSTETTTYETPKLKTDGKQIWNVSYDNGKTWTSLGVKATVKKTAAKKKKKYDKKIFAKAVYNKKNITVSWNRIEKADGYRVYIAQYDSKGKLITKKNLVQTMIKGSDKKYTIKALSDGSKLKNNVVYTIQVNAYQVKKAKKKTLTKSPKIYVVHPSHKELQTVKKIKLSRKNITLKVGKTNSIAAKEVNKGKKAIVDIRYYSTNKKIVKVDQKGTITAIKKGKAKVYVMAANGVKATVKVMVK